VTDAKDEPKFEPVKVTATAVVIAAAVGETEEIAGAATVLNELAETAELMPDTRTMNRMLEPAAISLTSTHVMVPADGAAVGIHGD